MIVAWSEFVLNVDPYLFSTTGLSRYPFVLPASTIWFFSSGECIISRSIRIGLLSLNIFWDFFFWLRVIKQAGGNHFGQHWNPGKSPTRWRERRAMARKGYQSIALAEFCSSGLRKKVKDCQRFADFVWWIWNLEKGFFSLNKYQMICCRIFYWVAMGICWVATNWLNWHCKDASGRYFMIFRPWRAILLF